MGRYRESILISSVKQYQYVIKCPTPTNVNAWKIYDIYFPASPFYRFPPGVNLAAKYSSFCKISLGTCSFQVTITLWLSLPSRILERLIRLKHPGHCYYWQCVETWPCPGVSEPCRQTPTLSQIDIEMTLAVTFLSLESLIHYVLMVSCYTWIHTQFILGGEGGWIHFSWLTQNGQWIPFEYCNFKMAV